MNFALTAVDEGSISSRAQIVTWTPLTNVNVDGQVFSKAAFYADKSVQVLGTFDGATLTMRGSNVPTPAVAGDWFTIRRTDGTALTFTAADGFTVLDNVMHISPLESGGTSNTSITVHLMCATSARK